MIGDMNKFVKFRNHNGGIIRVDNNTTCHITRIRSITLDGKTNTDVIYFVDGVTNLAYLLNCYVKIDYILHYVF